MLDPTHERHTHRLEAHRLAHYFDVGEARVLVERLAAFKVPAHVYFRDGPLPRNPAGKVLKRELRDELVG